MGLQEAVGCLEGRILRDLTPELKFASPQAAPLPLISPEGGHGLGLAPKDHAWVLRLLSQVLGSSGFSGEELPNSYSKSGKFNIYIKNV